MNKLEKTVREKMTEDILSGKSLEEIESNFYKIVNSKSDKEKINFINGYFGVKVINVK